MQSAQEPRRRVPPLPPEDRRAAIIEATLPLLEECGMTISTRQIAQAAGVAEGTIFRVFPDKPSLIRATILAATDPGRAVTALAAIPADADVRVRVAAVVDVLTERIKQHGRLFALAREMVIDEGLGGEFGQALAETRERTQRAVTKVIEPDASRLRVPPRTVARLLTSLVVSASGHMHGEPAHLTRDELVEVLLDGLLKPNAAATSRTDSPPGDHTSKDTAPEDHTSKNTGSKNTTTKESTC